MFVLNFVSSEQTIKYSVLSFEHMQLLERHDLFILQLLLVIEIISTNRNMIFLNIFDLIISGLLLNSQNKNFL